ncbi:MAG TPA: nuclear transport factor 2 family protein [Solirubrobacterales bacterium]
MSAADIERLAEAFEALERGEDEAALARIAPDFELRDHVILEDTSDGTGPEVMEANIGRLREAFDRVSYEILETIDLDERILVRVLASAHTDRDGGLDTELEVGQLWTIRDGLARRLEIFPSWDEARRAVGLEPGP